MEEQSGSWEGVRKDGRDEGALAKLPYLLPSKPC